MSTIRFEAKLEQICPDIERIVEEYALKVRGEVYPWAAGKAILWHRLAIEYSVALVPGRLGRALFVAGMVSRDLEEGMREGVSVPGMTLLAPVRSETLIDGLEIYRARLATGSLVLDGRSRAFRKHLYPIPFHSQFPT